jgi:hypothetical protein
MLSRRARDLIIMSSAIGFFIVTTASMGNFITDSQTIKFNCNFFAVISQTSNTKLGYLFALFGFLLTFDKSP